VEPASFSEAFSGFGGGTGVVFRGVRSSVTLRRARAARIGSHASDQSFVVDLVRASGLLLLLESWVRGGQARAARHDCT